MAQCPLPGLGVASRRHSTFLLGTGQPPAVTPCPRLPLAACTAPCVAAPAAPSPHQRGALNALQPECPSRDAVSCWASAGASRRLPSHRLCLGWLFTWRMAAVQVGGLRIGLAPNSSGLQAGLPVIKPAVGPARLLGKQRPNGVAEAVRYCDLEA